MTHQVQVPVLRKMEPLHTGYLLISEEMTRRLNQGRVFPFVRKSKPEMNAAIRKVEQ
jgi:hypothetical protein